MEKILHVTGTGHLSVKPDTIQLSLTLSDTFKTYETTVATSAQWTEQLQAVLSQKGFQKNELLTVHFSIDSRYENERDEGGQYRQVFKGYSFDHRLTLELAADNERLGEALSAIIESRVPVEFNISYTVKDQDKVKAELLQAAVSDALQTAKLMAKASKVSLGPIVQIRYSKEEIAFRRDMMRSAQLQSAEAMASFSLDIEPGHLDLKESVDIIWEIS